jgi:hypothetical protein
VRLRPDGARVYIERDVEKASSLSRLHQLQASRLQKCDGVARLVAMGRSQRHWTVVLAVF